MLAYSFVAAAAAHEGWFYQDDYGEVFRADPRVDHAGPRNPARRCLAAGASGSTWGVCAAERALPGRRATPLARGRGAQPASGPSPRGARRSARAGERARKGGEKGLFKRRRQRHGDWHQRWRHVRARAARSRGPGGGVPRPHLGASLGSVSRRRRRGRRRGAGGVGNGPTRRPRRKTGPETRGTGSERRPEEVPGRDRLCARRSARADALRRPAPPRLRRDGSDASVSPPPRRGNACDPYTCAAFPSAFAALASEFVALRDGLRPFQENSQRPDCLSLDQASPPRAWVLDR